jgi:Transcriptional Coactivator p15 (PC4)
MSVNTTNEQKPEGRNVIARFEKNSREEVWVSLDDFHGKKLINLRVHYRSEGGEWLPGKQGLAVSVDRYRDLAEAILKIGEELQAKQTPTESTD